MVNVQRSDVKQADKDALREAYSQVCAFIRATDDFRAKLLAILPIASGAAVILLLANPDVSQYLGAFGLFGLVVTLALFLYEIHGMRRCRALICKGRRLEDLLAIDPSARQFEEGQHRWLYGIISVPTASILIYLAVGVSWAFVMGIGFGWWGQQAFPASI
jgi:hypothetical protein